VLLLERQLAPENETQLRKQEKPPPERESVQLQQEKVQEEKLQGDLEEELPEEEDARTSYSFFKLHLIRTVRWNFFQCSLMKLALNQSSYNLYRITRKLRNLY